MCNILIKLNIYFDPVTTAVLKRKFRVKRTAREY
jgi:hypothetical protein